MSSKHPNSLSRHEKLKSRKQIDALFTHRRFFTQPPFRMFYHIAKSTGLAPAQHNPTLQTGQDTINITVEPNASGPYLKAGFSASKRYFKHATKRNRVKRLMREVYRTHNHSLIDIVEQHGYQISLFFLYGHKTLPTFKEVEEKLCPLLQKLEAKLASSSSINQ